MVKTTKAIPARKMVPRMVPVNGARGPKTEIRSARPDQGANTNEPGNPGQKENEGNDAQASAR